MSHLPFIVFPFVGLILSVYFHCMHSMSGCLEWEVGIHAFRGRLRTDRRSEARWQKPRARDDHAAGRGRS
ncbi:hypothetical protein RHIZ404_210263 [Rhizobium sp. EC-SD404]|nr:hypothetical protein RHIZ404_210263 [Rhizobium sp. EC-SD404]